jgi:hypothetical protein
MVLKTLSTILLTGSIALALGTSAACSSSDSGSTGGASTATCSFDKLDCSTAAGKDCCKQLAQQQATQSGQKYCQDVQGCACENCCTELQDCQADPNCVPIRDCGQTTGCRGLACYQDATCKAVIDANGGPTGVGAGIASALSNCLAGNPQGNPPTPALCPTTTCP